VPSSGPPIQPGLPVITPVVPVATPADDVLSTPCVALGGCGLLSLIRRREGKPSRGIAAELDGHDAFCLRPGTTTSGEQQQYVCVRVLSWLMTPPASIIAAVGHDMRKEVRAP